LSAFRQRLSDSSCGCTNPRPLKVACIFFESTFTRRLQKLMFDLSQQKSRP
jgi:hypothetical protein